jgi:hypothetical protein
VSLLVVMLLTKDTVKRSLLLEWDAWQQWIVNDGSRTDALLSFSLSLRYAAAGVIRPDLAFILTERSPPYLPSSPHLPPHGGGEPQVTMSVPPLS